MSDDPSDDQYSDEESARRRDEVLRRMLKTPPKPHKGKGDSKPSPKPRSDRAKAADRR